MVEETCRSVARYAVSMNQEIHMIAPGSGVRHARELARRPLRPVQPAGRSVALDVLRPLPPAVAAKWA